MAFSKELELKIVRRVFKDAEDAGWLTLPDAKRTEMYRRWLEDPAVGGRLTEFMSLADARKWLKERPMKEFSRAINGVGRYASLVAKPAIDPSSLVERALGKGWKAELETRKSKPLRLRARKDEEEVVFTWGPARDLKHLAWAALTAQAEGDHTPWVLCVVGSFENPIPADKKASHVRVAQRCQLRVVHVESR